MNGVVGKENHTSPLVILFSNEYFSTSKPRQQAQQHHPAKQEQVYELLLRPCIEAVMML
jgi:hypothetical protein